MHTACQTLMKLIPFAHDIHITKGQQMHVPHGAARCSVAFDLLLTSEQALLIQENGSQVGGTNMANCCAEDEQF